MNVAKLGHSLCRDRLFIYSVGGATFTDWGKEIDDCEKFEVK